METTGIIFAALDCDLDSVEEFNRWYDLEHVPPNVWLAGVMLGQRYAAPPALHAVRVTADDSPFADDHGSFLTLYTLCDEPQVTIDAMSELRDKLYAEDRMSFPADKKIVRTGDTLALVGATSDPGIRLPPTEVPFVGHTGLLVIERYASDEVDEWYRDRWATSVAEVDGVWGVASFHSAQNEGLQTDLVFIEGDAAAVTRAIRSAAPHHADARIRTDAPFERIDPLRYPWLDEFRSSSLPPTIND